MTLVPHRHISWCSLALFSSSGLCRSTLYLDIHIFGFVPFSTFYLIPIWSCSLLGLLVTWWVILCCTQFGDILFGTFLYFIYLCHVICGCVYLFGLFLDLRRVTCGLHALGVSAIGYGIGLGICPFIAYTRLTAYACSLTLLSSLYNI